MAAGISTEQKHQIECRSARGIQRDLAKHGIRPSYANRCLSGHTTGEGTGTSPTTGCTPATASAGGLPYVVVEGRSLSGTSVPMSSGYLPQT